MSKQKFQVPLPDEQTMQSQIRQIVEMSMEGKVSFLPFLKFMYQQIGMKHLFRDHSVHIFSLFTVGTIASAFFLKPASSQVQLLDLYGYIFLISPILFFTLSFYTYANKKVNYTFEVEMVCKYNVYQVIVFRMLLFSVMAILFNTLMITSMSLIYEEIHFFRAFMISNTGLFTFSVLFLFAMLKNRSTVVAMTIMIGWIFGHLFFISMENQLYRDVLVTLPLFVYAFVLSGAFYGYLRVLHRFIYVQHTEGAY